MTLEEIQSQILTLSTEDKWQLVQILLNAIQKDTTASTHSPENTYLLRDLPIVISEDFDDPIPQEIHLPFDLQKLFKDTQALPQAQSISEDEIHAEIEAYRQGL